MRMDSSTSPIPVITLARQKSTEQPKSIPQPTNLSTATKPLPEIVIEEKPSNSFNTSPRPFGSSKLKKPLKKVDFSKVTPTLIPETKWMESEIVDESDILTESHRSDESVDNNLRVEGPYDGDESELCDMKSCDTTIEDEQEEWMREEVEQARREELEERGEWREGEQWSQQAMELINDEGQSERDLAIVAALNDRLQGIREMEEEDRLKAIECIERHQMNLEDQQEQLANLLDSAIKYLRTFEGIDASLPPLADVVASASASGIHDVIETVTPPTPPTRRSGMNIRTDR